VSDAPDPADGFAAAVAGAHMVPLLPCADVDEMAEFWTALGLERTYRQLRPNPYVALSVGGVDLHYYGMPTWDPEASHSTCAVVVADTGPVHARFTQGLRALYGSVPVSGTPRITRPRRRANNGALSGFSLVDPAGNWVRFSRAPDAPVVDGPGDSTTWTSDGGGSLARAVENAVVVADSHGDVAQARKVLGGAVRRATTGTASVDEGPGVLATALAYPVELHVRLGDDAAARTALDDLRRLAGTSGADDDVVASALAEATEVVGEA
jgi:hypothetical protein